uniref:Vascular endothelial growth factor receptor 2 n=2 Tax=Anthurium amnicola TaxID=1678845 RepID=A0A1D1YH50_9ARAE
MEAGPPRVEGMAASAAAGSSNNMAIVVDKRPPHRPGGCIGIFFQLFDWNRRIAKKRFFSRKLLPQDRAAKRISKKLSSEERMPAAKPLAIAAENQGGFPNTKRVEAKKAMGSSVHSSKREKGMSAPGLVARLMGLESMPATARYDKPRKSVGDVSSPSSNGFCIDPSRTSCSPYHKPEELGSEMGGGGHDKLDLRPQKLQKLGFFERRPSAAARVRSEALLFNRSMLGRSRKQHYKLASPVKSPRLAGRRSSARLMEAATRILEPRNRTRCALTYMAPLQANVEGIDAPPLQRPSISTPFVSPCHNCGSLVEVPDLRLNANESQLMDFGPSSTSSEFSSNSSHSGFDEALSNPPVMLKDKKKSPSLAVQAKTNVQRRSHYLAERISQIQNELEEQSEPQMDVAGSTSFLKQNKLRRGEMPLIRERVFPATKLGARVQGTREPRSFIESRDFIDSNRNLNSCTRAKTDKAMGNRRLEMEKDAWERKSLVCNRRSSGNNNKSENVAAVNPTFLNKKSYASDMPNGKGPRLISARTVHGNSAKSENRKLGDGKCGSGSKNGVLLSPRVDAPVKNNSMSYGLVTEKRRNEFEHGHGGISQSGTLTNGSDMGKLSSERVLDERIDALSAILEQKIRELTFLNQDELEAGDGIRSARPTAAVLEELISALSAARPLPLKRQDDSPLDLKTQDESCYERRDPYGNTYTHGPKFNTTQNFQEEGKSGVLTEVVHASDYEQHSPMSILEASFSNESCLSESFNSSSGHRPHAGFTDSSSDKLLSRDLDTDLSDSATSSNIRRVERWKARHVLDNSSIMHNINSPQIDSSKGRNNYFSEVISNAELLFGETSLDTPDGTLYSPIDPILLDTLDNLVDVLREGHTCNLNQSETKGRFQFRRFLFDCIMEHLDMKYSHFCKMGYKEWAKLPLLTGDGLTRDICEEIESCRGQAGMDLDDIVQKEVKLMGRNWMDFQIEAFEAGAEIENNLLQLLVGETVIELLGC